MKVLFEQPYVHRRWIAKVSDTGTWCFMFLCNSPFVRSICAFTGTHHLFAALNFLYSSPLKTEVRISTGKWFHEFVRPGLPGLICLPITGWPDVLNGLFLHSSPFMIRLNTPDSYRIHLGMRVLRVARGAPGSANGFGCWSILLVFQARSY